MIGFKVFASTPTTIDLNGPILSFLQEPVGIRTDATVVSLTGIVTSTPVGTGHLSYQWYEIGVGKLVDGSSISGAASTSAVGGTSTLSLSNLESNEGIRQFYLQTEYVASAYGTGTSTGKALNGPLVSDTVDLTFMPLITIDSQPGIATIASGGSAIFNTAASVSDNTDNQLTYQWQQEGADLSDSSTVTGAATTSLTISSSTVGETEIQCIVTHPFGSNSPQPTNPTTLNVVDESVRKMIYVEEYDVNATLYSTQEFNIVNPTTPVEIIPDQTGIAATSNWNRIYSIYAPEDDVSVKVTLSGAAGADYGSFIGGQGGVSTFELTLTKGQEYVANLGAAIWPSGGSAISDAANGGDGGGGSFFYKGGELIVASGGGSGARNQNGQAGYGGGLGVNPTLSPIGEFPGGESSESTLPSTGGRVGGCTIGDYWETQGIAPCASIGSTTFFTGKDGQKTLNGFGLPVTRGYKAGLNYQFNAGNASPGNNGGGGGGSLGGDSNEGGSGFDGLGSVTGTLGGNTRKVGVIKIEVV